MWEVVVLHGLSKQGALQNEVPLPCGRRPDVGFMVPELSFIADITAVSDEGLDEQNPYRDLSRLIEESKTRLNLPAGGVDLRVLSKTEWATRGSRTVLKLPERKRVREFVRSEIEPKLKEQILAGEAVLCISLEDETIGIRITIDPSKSPFSSGTYAAYDIPTIKDRNPLYNALKAKASQLRSAPGLTGVIVGDANTRMLAGGQMNWNEVTAQAIALEFLRQHSSIGFVLLLSVREGIRNRPGSVPPGRRIHAHLVTTGLTTTTQSLNALFEAMAAEMPKPVAMPVNAALRAREAGYSWGHHGGYQMSAKRIKISARVLVELLAGRRTIEETNALHDWIGPGAPRKPNQAINPFERHLRDGRLPTAISVIRTDENDSDDWIEFEFCDRDPAISPLR